MGAGSSGGFMRGRQGSGKTEWSGGEAIVPGLVAAFEARAGVVLPQDHRAVALSHDGASLPDGTCIMVPDAGRPGRVRAAGLWLLPFAPSPLRLTMGGMLDIGWRRIPGLVAFAIDEAGDEFAFDLGGDGCVVHVDRSAVETVVVSRIADGLAGLLDAVVPDPGRVADGDEAERWLALMLAGRG